jgi:hypothetical protein
MPPLPMHNGARVSARLSGACHCQRGERRDLNSHVPPLLHPLPVPPRLAPSPPAGVPLPGYRDARASAVRGGRERGDQPGLL